MTSLIESLSLSAVRSFRKRQDLVFAPVTLIYGPNSSGKSSVLESVAIYLQTSDSNRRRPLSLETDGHLYSEGGFASVVSDHDLEATMEIGLGLPRSGNPSEVHSVKSQFRFNRKEGFGQVTSLNYLYGLEKSPVKLSLRPGRKASSSGRSTDDVYVPSSLRDAKLITDLFGLDATNESGGFRYSFETDGIFPGSIRRMTNRNELRTSFEGLRQANETWMRTWASIRNSIDELRRNIVYLGPLRDMSTQVVTRETDASVFSDHAGSNTIFDLVDSEELTSAVGGWLDRLGIRYVPKILRLTSDEGEIPGTNVDALVLEERESGLKLGIRDVGFGVSQVLPVVTAALGKRDSVIMIEQPEIHLHPRLQAELAELITQSASTRGNQFILETHSEHLLLRIRRLIRRGTIPTELVSILYVDPRIDGTADVIEIDLGDDGEFLDEWPDGFFPERFNELFGD